MKDKLYLRQGAKSVGTGKNTNNEHLFLLRLWKDKDTWQVSLKNVDTKEVSYFKTFDSFLAQLEVMELEFLSDQPESVLV